MTLKILIRITLCLTLLNSLGCGGGGGGGSVGGSSGGTTPPMIIPPALFSFLNFSANSKLTVVSTFQPTQETVASPQTFAATLSRTSGAVLPRSASVASLGESESITDHCGTADVTLSGHLLAEEPIRPRQLEGIRPRYQALAEGAQESLYLVPAGASFTFEKILQPAETTHCTILAEVINGNPVIDRTRALAIATAFDTNNPNRPGSGIYSQVRAVFGSEWNQNPPGGLDGDDKIVIVFFGPTTLGANLFGFMSPADSNPAAGVSSNKGEFVYLNAGKSNEQLLATLAHEFQHLINQNEKVNQQGANPVGAQQENVTVNEGLSGLAEEVCGFSLDNNNQLLRTVINDYLSKPEKHEFFDFYQTGFAYGQGYLFFKYVREHFGDNVIRDICTSKSVGKSNLDAQLPVGFAETFRRWTLANYATNLTGAVPAIYRYPSGFKTNGTYAAGTLSGVKTFPLTGGQVNNSQPLNAWSVNYLVFSQGSGQTLEVSIDPQTGLPYGLLLEQIANQFTSLSQ